MTLEEYVVMVLENGDVDNAQVEYNVPGIARELEKHGVTSVATQGIEYKLDSEVSEEVFWSVVQKHEWVVRESELWDEWVRANELIDSRAGYKGYLLYDDSDTLDTIRGVLRDVCRECAVNEYNNPDNAVSDAIGYEGHEDVTGGTCAMCGQDFWGMKDGALVLFEPKYVMKRWG